MRPPYSGTWLDAQLWPPNGSGAWASGVAYQTMGTLPEAVEKHVIKVSPGGATDWTAQLLLEIQCSYPILTDGSPPMTIRLPEKGAEGIDLSANNLCQDGPRLIEAGKTFCYVRTTMGAPSAKYPGVDSRWRYHRAIARLAGMLDGAYHYLVNGISAIDQYENLAGQIRSDFGCLPIVGDAERRRDADGVPEFVNKQSFTVMLYDWLRRCEDSWKHKPLIYTNLPEWLAMTTEPAWATDYQFIAAQYNSVLNSVHPSWNVVCWQYAVKPIPSISDKNIDHDRWLGQAAPVPGVRHNFASMTDPKYKNTHQAVINLFYKVAGDDYSAWIAHAGLNGIYAVRTEVYSGPDVEALPLTDAEKAKLIAAML